MYKHEKVIRWGFLPNKEDEYDWGEIMTKEDEIIQTLQSNYYI